MRSSTTGLRLSQVFAKQRDHISLRLMRRKRAVVFGVGQLGSLSALYLAKSGIGSLTLLDRDTVELRNTNVQSLYSPQDVGLRKADVVREKLKTLAPWTKVKPAVIEIPNGYGSEHETAIGIKRTEDLVKGADVALSCVDNIGTRVTIAKICRDHGIPLFDAGVLGMNGQVLATVWNKTPCIACLNLSGAGSTPCLLASTVCSGAMVSSIQSALVIDHIHRREIQQFVTVDLQNFRVSPISVKPKDDCWLCGGGIG